MASCGSQWAALVLPHTPLVLTAPPAGTSSPSECLPDPSLAPGDFSAPPAGSHLPSACALPLHTHLVHPGPDMGAGQAHQEPSSSGKGGEDRKASIATRVSFLPVPLHRWL